MISVIAVITTKWYNGKDFFLNHRANKRIECSGGMFIAASAFPPVYLCHEGLTMLEHN